MYTMNNFNTKNVSFFKKQSNNYLGQPTTCEHIVLKENIKIIMASVVRELKDICKQITWCSDAQLCIKN